MTVTETEAMDLFVSIVPAQHLRAVFVQMNGNGVTEVTGLGRHDAERRIVGALGIVTGQRVCERCGGTGRYGSLGPCYDCGGRRLI